MAELDISTAGSKLGLRGSFAVFHNIHTYYHYHYHIKYNIENAYNTSQLSEFSEL